MSQYLTARRLSLTQGPGRFMVFAAAFLAAITLFTGFSTAKSTYLIVDEDRIYTVEGYSDDIAEAFIRAGITLGEDDTFEATEYDDYVRIHVIRTTVTAHSGYEIIPFETIRRPNPELKLGVEQAVQEGMDGIRAMVTETRTVTGRNSEVSSLGVKVFEPLPRIIEYGTMLEPVAQSYLSVTDDVLVSVDEQAGLLTTASGQVLPYSDVLTCTATAYTTELQAWKITATGTTARLGAIAVDPRVISYGTKMYIVSADGSITYGIATAEDCGGSIKGNKIDLFFDTYDECINFGRRPCTVYILK